MGVVRCPERWEWLDGCDKMGVARWEWLNGSGKMSGKMGVIRWEW